MIKESDAQRCVGFLEVVRTAIDDAEFKIAGAIDSQRAGLLLSKACAQIEVAALNLKWTAEEISRMASSALQGGSDGASVDGVSAGRTVVSTEKVGCDQVPESAASASKYPA